MAWAGKKIGMAVSILKNTAKGFFAHHGTYCPFLWDSVFIDQRGDVFICCHAKPGKIGNIYRQSLRSLWIRSSRLKVFRFMSLHNCLYCFSGCTRIPVDGRDGSASHPVHSGYPKRLWIQYSEFCNLDCIMCGQNHRSRVSLDNVCLKKHIEWDLVEDIELQGGEILVHKNARELYHWLTRCMHKKVNLITNGLFLDDEWADYLVGGSNRIVISVNAATAKTHECVNRGSDFTKVINNIRRLVGLKHKHASVVSIVYKFTIVPQNVHEISGAIQLADALGCDKIQFGYDSTMPGFLEENKDKKCLIRDELNQLMSGDNLKIEIGRHRLILLGFLDT